uniref:PD-(D/E)XK nuclease superfamily protein n=1 Tax=viral metagenome TaxID=1070528 RepID=A0A6M3JHJ8_9ZZZZ
MEPQDDIFAPPTELKPMYFDRSTAERWCTCPFQAWAVEHKKCINDSDEAASGQEVHRVIAEAIGEWLAGHERPRDYMEAELAKVRPDVQADAMAALRPSLWRIHELIISHNPADVRAYQGGGGELSGQFAREILPASQTRGPVLATSEIDLLMSGASKYELEETDWKSGQKRWTSRQVLSAFQFQMHAWLVFGAYPDVEQVHVQVFMPRLRDKTPRVTFRRGMCADFDARLLEAWRWRERTEQFATEAAIAWEDIPWSDEYTWPTPRKCDPLMCPAVLQCPRDEVRPEEGGVIERVKDLTVLEAKVARVKERLKAYVDEHGEIVGDGVAYGSKWPRTKTYETLRAYTPPDGGEELTEGQDNE